MGQALAQVLNAFQGLLGSDERGFPFVQVTTREAGQNPAGLIQALLTAPMPCGVGACQACWVETARGRQQVCQQGPVFIW